MDAEEKIDEILSKVNAIDKNLAVVQEKIKRHDDYFKWAATVLCGGIIGILTVILN